MQIIKANLAKLVPHPDVPYVGTEQSAKAGDHSPLIICDLDMRVVFGWDSVLGYRRKAMFQNLEASTIEIEVLVLGQKPVESALAITCVGKFQEIDYKKVLEVFPDPSAVGFGDYRDISGFFESAQKASAPVETSGFGFFAMPGGLK